MGCAEPDREQLRSRLAGDLDARPEILLALLHGSFARGEAFRDIDVVVWLFRIQVSGALDPNGAPVYRED